MPPRLKKTRCVDWARCALEGALLSAARSRREAKLLQVGDAVEVNESPCDHQDVEQLVRVELGEKADREKGERVYQTSVTSEEKERGKKNVVIKKKGRVLPVRDLSGFSLAYPDVTLAREEPLGDASGVQARSGDVERGHEQQPAHLSHGGGLDQTLADDEVQGGNHTAQTQTHKHP